MCAKMRSICGVGAVFAIKFFLWNMFKLKHVHWMKKMPETMRTLYIEESELYATMFHECKFANYSNSTLYKILMNIQG